MRDDKLRFGAKASDGRCSSSWIAIRRKSDVYLGVRSLSGKLKLTLHKDGRAHIALTDNFYPQLRDEGVPLPPSRHFTRWRMPDVPDDGAVHVASVVFPSRFLRPRPPLKPNETVFWEPAPELGALEVGVFYGRQLATFASGSRLRFWTRLGDGRVVMVAVRNTDADATHVVDRLSRPNTMYALSAALWNASPGEAIASCAAFVWSDVRDGQAVVIWEVTGLSIHRN